MLAVLVVAEASVEFRGLTFCGYYAAAAREPLL